MAGRLRINPDPLRVVPDSVREVWTRPALTPRCEDCGSTRARLREARVLREVRGRVLTLDGWLCIDRRGCLRRQQP